MDLYIPQPRCIEIDLLSRSSESQVRILAYSGLSVLAPGAFRPLALFFESVYHKIVYFPVILPQLSKVSESSTAEVDWLTIASSYQLINGITSLSFKTIQ